VPRAPLARLAAESPGPGRHASPAGDTAALSLFHHLPEGGITMPDHWFRLDDVLPLAEHALACERHSLTSAEVLAGATTSPALIFSSNPEGAGLRSNGVPGWYDATGGEQRAHAQTWRHTQTGRSGHDHLGGYQDAFLPLTAPVVHLLRTAHLTGHSWLSVHIDSRDQHLITPYALQTSEHHGSPVPVSAYWKKTTVTCADVADTGYPALVPVGYTTTDGDVLPRFDRNTIARIVDDLERLRTGPHADTLPGEYPILRLRGDDLIVLEDQPDHGTWTYRQVDRLQPDRDGYFALGAYQWPWHIEARPSRLPSWLRRWLPAAGHRPPPHRP
jgi:hypothetical protein